MSSESLHIASLVVQAQPDHLSAVAEWIRSRPDTEVRAEDPAGKLVVITEGRHEGEVADLLDQIQHQTGVLSANLIYHEILDAETADQPEEAES